MPIQLHPIFDDLHNPVLTAQLRWHVSRYELHTAAKRWPAALDSLEKIAEKLPKTSPNTTQTWQRWLLAITHTALRAELFDEFTRLFNQYGHHGFPDHTLPFALAPAFSHITDSNLFTTAAKFGEFLAGHYPDCPLGFYLTADFSERASAHVRSRPPTEIHTIVQNYQAAIQLSQTHNLPDVTLICRLRLGAFLLTTGTDRNGGRQLLKSISINALTPSDALWYARAMLHSQFWLDRVRTADTLDSLANTTKTDPETIRTIARILLHASPFELQPAEHNRLTTLANTLFTGPEAHEWHQLLELRPILNKLHNQPLNQAQDTFNLLNRLARTQSPWQDTFHSFARLQNAFTPSSNQPTTTTLQRPNDTHRYRFSELTADILDALATPNNPKTTELLRTLHTLLRRFTATEDPMELKPIALLWPRILPQASKLQPDDLTNLQQSAILWTTLTPAPSYGFWLIAAHFLRAKLPLAARTAATRALSDATPAPHSLRRHILAHLTDHAIQTLEPDAMLFWLTHLKHLEKSPSTTPN